jgi:outer membrane protein assembly factor BamD (BamD/ComL family)
MPKVFFVLALLIPCTFLAAQTQPQARLRTSAELDRIERLIERGANRTAFRRAVDWANVHKEYPQRDRSLFLIAQSLYNTGDLVKAFYYLDELLDEYPDSQLYYPALEKQFQVAEAFFNGKRLKFLGMPLFHGYDEAIEMLYRIQTRSPGSPLAERSLLRSAEFYYADGQYDFAADTYGAYLRSYPRSPYASQVRLRQAFANYAQFRGPKFDATPIIDAREQLRAVMAADEKLAAEEKIAAILERIDRELARKLLITGDFYRRTRAPRGAVYTYRYLAKAYPETKEAQQVNRRLRTIPAWALNSTPEPAITPGFAPGSPPEEEPRMSHDKQRRQ